MNKNKVVTFDLRSIVGIAIVALIIVLLFMIRSGFWGGVVGGILVTTLIHRLDRIRGIFGAKKDQFPDAVKWFYDLFEDREGFSFTAKVPGPVQEVKVKLRKDVLSVRGGNDFSLNVQAPRGAKLQENSYIKGVLHVKLQKPKKPTSSFLYGRRREK